jgi:hypothetical protein
VGGPIVAAGATARAATPIARMSGEELIAQIERYEEASASNTYALGACLRELSQPKRYKDELGFQTFEELLVARELPSRVTAFKLINVVSTYSDAEVKQLGGTEKSYAIIRYAKYQQGANSDPRKYLLPNARLLGTAIAKLSTREINGAARASKGNEDSDALAESSAAKKTALKASSKLGHALKQAGLKHRMRVHAHGEECVSAHFDAPTATTLADLLAKLRKLEKQPKPR